MRIKIGIATLAALLLALASAPAAGAQTGVTSYFAFPQAPTEGPATGPLDNPGSLYRIGGVAINHNGTGGAAPGDLYALDIGTISSKPRVEQFAADGTFERLWPAPFGSTDIAVDQASGDVLLASNAKVTVYSASGVFLREFGFDAVAAGPDDSSFDAQQRLTIAASGGTFTLGAPSELVTVPLPYDATKEELEDALNQLTSISEPMLFAGVGNPPVDLGPAHVTVTGGPGDSLGSSPYTITFHGALGGDNFRTLTADGSNLSGAASATIITTVQGGGYEICRPTDTCRPFPPEDDLASSGGTLSRGTLSLGIAPSSAPNAGDVLVTDQFLGRASEFSPGGAFLRAFGWDVVAHGPGDSNVDEQQQVTVSATGGKFSLSFPSFTGSCCGIFVKGPTTGAEGTGNLSSGSTTVSNVVTSNGAFAVGESITANGVPTATTITALGPGTLTLSQAANANLQAVQLIGNDLPFDASATEVETALNALPTVGPLGGALSVSGPSGGPYTVTFGGTLGGDDLRPITTSAAGLTGAAKSATVTTLADGGAFETCTAASADVCQAAIKGSKLGQFSGTPQLGGIAEDSSGAIYVADAQDLDNFTVAHKRVDKFTPSGPGFTPSVFGAPEKQAVTVNATAGQFHLAFAEPRGTKGSGLVGQSQVITAVATTVGAFAVGQPITSNFGIQPGTTIIAVSPTTITLSKPPVPCDGCTPQTRELVSTRLWQTADFPFDIPASGGVGPTASLENALDQLSPIAAQGSLTVTGGPGGASAYTVSFDGGLLNGQDLPSMTGASGATPLSGGSGPGANQVTVDPLFDGTPTAVEGERSPTDIAIDDADHIWVSKYTEAGEATCADGSPSPPDTRIQEFSPAGDFLGISSPCLAISPRAFTQSNLSVDPLSGEPYMSVGSSALPSGPSALIFGDLGAAPALTLHEPSDLGQDGVTVSGTINPGGPAGSAGHPHPTNTTYRVEYRKQGESGWTTFAPDIALGAGSTPVPFTTGLSGLTPKTGYEIRVVVSKLGFAPVIGATQAVTTKPAPPTVDAFSSSDVTASSAILHALVNPLGTDTTVHFEYGTTLAYGQRTPDVDIGEALGAVATQQLLEGLEPLVYHFRVVATNSVGTTTTTDQTFNFYPGSCPNEAARQQTGSGGLPDCRAYELVSPADAGAATLSSGGPVSPSAISPARLSFIGSLGSIPGSGGNPPSVLGDLYVASRGVDGWHTRYVGIPADQSLLVGGPPNSGFGSFDLETDLGMNQFLDWSKGQQLYSCCGEFGSMAPYVWDAEGNSLGRLPTNLDQIPGASADLAEGGFVGDIRPSPDFRHFFFSSANIAFAPGGQVSENGSVYDNDVGAGTVSLVSKLADGSPIPQEPGDHTDDYFKLPAASTDGSHLLIAAAGTGVCGVASCPAPATCNEGCPRAPFAELCGGNETRPSPCPDRLPSHLYMRVGGGPLGVTYDVSRGHLVDYKGMTSDGSKVFFTSSQQLTPDDEDTSTDLFFWSEAADSITRVSVGQGLVGNSDACNSTWIVRCGVEVVSADGGAGEFSESSDNSVSAESGDVYFYSPEQLVPSRGIPGRRNLYVLDAGQVHFVATLDPDRPLLRIQVSPDGHHAAFLTASRLTTYENTSPTGACSTNPETGEPTGGARCLEMYTYQAEDGSLKCVSCIPTGIPPHYDVAASQNGIFMSDDGRAFFSTRDQVVPEDTNGLTDVYEYVDGRPQLISSGLADRESTIAGHAGLVGVSATGADAYFATFDRLVAADRNGKFLRFYDARTGGGFPVSAQVAPCAAADECHGPASSAPTSPAIGSTADLGDAGNLRPAAHRKRRRHKHHAARHRGKKHGHRSGAARGGRR